MAVQLRDGRPEDEALLGIVYRRSSLSNAGDRDQLLAHPETLEFRYPEGAIVRVAADGDGRVMGFATVLSRDGTFELEDLFVDPDSMRSGIGTALVRDVSNVARHMGAASIEVTANPHARAFYESVGFVTIGVAATTFGDADRMRLATDRAG